MSGQLCLSKYGDEVRYRALTRSHGRATCWEVWSAGRWRRLHQSKCGEHFYTVGKHGRDWSDTQIVRVA